MARRIWPALAVVTAACTTLLGDFERIVAIEILGSARPTLEEGTTLQLEARALTAAGDPAPNATITWELLSPDPDAAGFTLDPSGLVTGLAPGSGEVRARVENLRSGVITVTVTAAPDSLALAGDERLTYPGGLETSPPLRALLLDLTTEPGSERPLAGKSVEFSVVEPGPGAARGFFLSDDGADPGEDPLRVMVTTGQDGVASVVVRRTGDTAPPDSAVVEAAASTARGSAVPGSPVRFVVLFP
jgi:hypothetical protein